MNFNTLTIKNLISFFFLIFLLHFKVTEGQNNAIKFNNLSVEDGLSQGWIRCIFQDKYGFLWFGTGDGLNKFDGYTFKIYKNSPHNPYSLVNNNIRKIFQDSKGNLWIATQGGLHLYNRELDNIIPISSTLQHSVEDISESPHGNLLLATPDGLFLYDQKDSSLISMLSGEYVNAILKSTNGNYWLGTYDGLFRLNFLHGSYKIAKIKGIDNNIRSLCEDFRGRIWLGTNYSGLILMKFKGHHYDKPLLTNFIHKNNDNSTISHGAILCIIEDNDRKLWIGVENGGLNILDLNARRSPRSVFKHYTNDPSDNTGISENSVQSEFIDDQNTVWIGTYGGGLDYYNKLLEKFKTIRKIPGNKNSISNNHVNVIYNEKDNLWIGSEGGLDVYDKKDHTYRHFVHSNNPNSLGANAVWSIFRDDRNNMWIGTWAGGLNLMNEKTGTFRHFLNKPDDETSIGGNNIFHIIQDQGGELWIASMIGGLNKYDYKTGEFQQFQTSPQKNSISNNWVQNIMEYGANEIWIATVISVDVYNKKTGKFISFRHDPSDKKSISCNGANELFEDSKKHIWIGTEEGLNLFHRHDSSFTYYREEDGLPNNTVDGICEDNHGNLWLSTNKGISKFVNGVNVPPKPVFKNYDVSDGLQGNEFIPASKCKDENGNIYFGGTNGFNVFNPDSIKDNPIKPSVVFTNFLIYNKPVKIGAENSPLKRNINLTTEITLNHKQTVFSIEFAALSYISPEKNQYAFIMDGFEKEWNYVGHQRMATYTNLNPGRYIFKVKASNGDGRWNNKYSSLIITILPPWWWTWWTKIFYFLLAVIALYFFRKYTLISVQVKNQLMLDHIEKQKSEELNKLKIQFFTNISHELRTPLSLILSPLEDIINSTTEKLDIRNQLTLIYKNAKKLFGLVNDLMDFTKVEDGKLNIKVQRDNIVKFTREIYGYFNEMALRQQIDYKFDTKIQETDIWFDREKLEKIIVNLLFNAFKFTPRKGKIVVSVEKLIPEQLHEHASKLIEKTEYVCISVLDNGAGIAPEHLDKIFDRFYQAPVKAHNYSAGTGVGLALAKSFAELQHGFITVKSEPEKQTVFSVFLPIGKNHFQPSEIINDHVDVNEKNINHQAAVTGNTKKKLPVSKNVKPAILVVEDNYELREYLISRLEENYRISAAENGKTGYEKIIEHEPDLVISDILMPEVSGIELCRKIRENIITSHIPVILLTAKATLDDKIEGIETGADTYVTKPFNIQYLEVVIRKLIESRRRLYQRFSQDVYILPKEMTKNSVDQDFLEQAINYVHNNLMNPHLSIDDLAQALSMSKSSAYRKIKALTDQSMNNFIKIIRLKSAIKLMNEGKLNITEIAFRVGFTSPAYFTKCFREQFGKSPSSYLSNNSSYKNNE